MSKYLKLPLCPSGSRQHDSIDECSSSVIGRDITNESTSGKSLLPTNFSDRTVSENNINQAEATLHSKKDNSRRFSLAKFEYKPLDTTGRYVRVVQILQRRRLSPFIECKIKQVPLARNTFTCLSYASGEESSPSRTILLNGKRKQVRRNLWTFLNSVSRNTRVCQIRTQAYPTLFWIDALCIDQANNTEKGHQVNMMGDIYREAAEVIVWLGPLPTTNMQTLEATDRELRRICEEEMLSLDDRSQGIYKALYQRRYPAEFAVSCGLLTAAYWDRVWTLQEITLNDNVSVLVGDEALPLGYLYCLITMHRELSGGRALNFPFIVARVIEGQKGSFNRSYNPRALDIILPRVIGAECHDWRDCIYGIKALCWELQHVPVSYTCTRAELMAMVLINIQEAYSEFSMETLMFQKGYAPRSSDDWLLMRRLMLALDVLIMYRCQEWDAKENFDRHVRSMEVKIVEHPWETDLEEEGVSPGRQLANNMRMRAIDGLCQHCRHDAARVISRRRLRKPVMREANTVAFL